MQNIYSPHTRLLVNGVKDFGYIFFAMAVLTLMRRALFLGVNNFEIGGIILDSFYYGIPTGIIFFITIRLGKSPFLFLMISLIYAVISYRAHINSIINFQIAPHLVVKAEGKITPFGMLFYLFYPPTFLVLFSLNLWCSHLFLRKIAPTLSNENEKVSDNGNLDN
ncbi:MAG TPA: hypothetical protein VK211_14610 [Kamptonema sp.]|nr:hypothetical protein [Kamptonema sp.]